MPGIFKFFFPEKVTFKSEFIIDADRFRAIIDRNRATLASIPNWIDSEAFKNSCFQYGVPEYIYEDINKELNKDATYTDLMIALAQQYFQDLTYLEIGVSVGKNFYQLINNIPSGTFTGFDIEDINPILESKLEFVNSEEWETPRKSIKRNASSFKTYNYQKKKVEYLSGDVWDENSWAKLEGRKFNLIFSDALHSAEAILFEFEMLVKYRLLDDRFIIIWDDLHGKMKRSFLKIIRNYDQAFNIKDVYLIQINGWIGQYEAKHPVGIISNFDISA